jgi:hypothetical protein
MAEPRRLFDIRHVIGGLFLAYGLILTITGLFDTPAEIAKAEGIRINLWTGVGMLIVGAVFVVWGRLRPAAAPSEEDDV